MDIHIWIRRGSPPRSVMISRPKRIEGERETYRLGASFEDSSAVEALIILDGVAVLDDAFGAAKVWGSATMFCQTGMPRKVKTYSSDVSAFGCIWTRIDREECSPGRTSYSPSTLRAESFNLS
jgi:hypothetical protein